MRFTDHASGNTLVKVMTDGILLAEMQRDRELRRYDTVIIDKAHERSLNIDFRGYLKQLSRRRPDLKVIITSATIDSQRLPKHFDDAPIIEVLATSVAETSGMSGTLGPRASRDTASAPRFSTSRSSPSPGPVPVPASGHATGHRHPARPSRPGHRLDPAMTQYPSLSAHQQPSLTLIKMREQRGELDRQRLFDLHGNRQSTTMAPKTAYV